MPTAAARLDAIDHVLALDLGGRGIAAFFAAGAALAAARALLRPRRVLIVTGFCLPPGVPETDGPPGAAVLGRAVRRMGARVRYLTDAAVAAPLAAALGTLGEPADIDVFSGPDEAAAQLRAERPTHLVAVERPGRARSGDYLSARGESVAPWNSPIDALFLAGKNGRVGTGHRPASGPRNAPPRGRRAAPVTIGVGDGGNEIGMGNVRQRLIREGRLMAAIASVVRVDHLVVAGTSNWGAYGIVAGLERLARRPLLHTPELERRMIEACVEAGAVDGVLRLRQATVDGIGAGVHASIVELLRLAAPGPEERRAAMSRAAAVATSGMMGTP